MPKRAYDFVVIGAGSAGCLLARKLIQANLGTVAIIEAGDALLSDCEDVRTIVPAFYPRTFQSRLDWSFSTEPQPGLNSRRIAWPRGKTLGGSGAINAMIYLQAAANDFDRWANAGCSDWSWTSVEPLLRTVATEVTKCKFSDLPLAEIAEPHPWSSAFIEACEQYGLPRKQPWLQAESSACGLYSLTQYDGRRRHVGQQLASTLPNENVDVIRGATVQNLKIDNRRVESIRLTDSSNNQIEIKVGGEAILCAGTIGSPSILLRSGIGPAKSSRDFGIGVVQDLPGVGENLQDHLMYPLVYRARSCDGMPARFSVDARERFRKQESLLGRRGPLASNIAEAGAVFGERDAEYQIHFTPTHYLKYPSRTAPLDCFSLAVNDLHPHSRGRLQLSDEDQFAPRIDPCYLHDSEDIERLLSAIATCREIANQPSLSELIDEEILPGSKRMDATSLQRSIQSFSRSIYHPVGTCRMGIDSMSVVDPSLRVHGFDNLHVADASVLPDLPSANTQAVTLLIAARKFSWLKAVENHC